MGAEQALLGSPTLVWVTLVLSVVGARAIYVACVRFRLRFNVTPWRLPAWAWALFVFLFLPLGVIAFLIARATTRPRSAPLGGTSPVLRGDLGARASGSWTGVASQPGDSYGLGSAHPPPASLPPAGWYPDPSSRHELRYWDGKGWAADVSDRGVRGEDPS